MGGGSGDGPRGWVLIAVVILYLVFGFLFYAAAGTMPADPLWDLQGDRARRPRRREIAAAVGVWLIGLLLWPLALVVRGVLAFRTAGSWRR